MLSDFFIMVIMSPFFTHLPAHPIYLVGDTLLIFLCTPTPVVSQIFGHVSFLKFNMLSLVSPKFGIMSWLLDLLKMSHEFIYNDIRIGCCTVRLAALPDPTYKGYLAQFEAIMNTPFIWNQTAKDLLTVSLVFVTFWMFFVELCIIFHFFPSCLEYGPAKLDIFQ